MQNAANLAFRVDHGVEADPFAVPGFNAARLAEINVTRQFTHDQDVEAGHHFGFERRGVGQFRIKKRGPQVGEQPEFLADAQQAALGTQFARIVVPPRAANGTEQDGIGCLGELVRRLGKRIFGRIDGTAAQQGLFHLDVQVECLEDAHRLGSNFRADAVAR